MKIDRPIVFSSHVKGGMQNSYFLLIKKAKKLIISEPTLFAKSILISIDINIYYY